MSIFLTETDRVIVQGMTGSEGRKHTTRMLSAGTKVVAGVNPRKAGTTVAFDVAPIGPGAGEVQAGTVEVPVYGTVAEAKEATGAEVSVVFVPPAFAADSILEAVDAGIEVGVYNRSPDKTADLQTKGAKVYPSSTELIRAYPVIFLMVSDYAAVLDILDELIDSLKKREKVN